MNSHSYFWRHPAQLLDLQSQIAGKHWPNGLIKVWCAGCARGQEAFSLAALLADLGRDFEITATDLCADNIETAETGEFARSKNSNFPKRLERFFKPSGDSLQLRPELLKRVTFKVDDLRESSISGRFHLIVCRNVLIYFTPVEIQATFEFFRKRLSRDGLLVLGYAEATLTHLSSEFVATGRHATYQTGQLTPSTAPANKPSVQPTHGPLNAAIGAFANGQLEKARDLFRRTLELHPTPQLSHYFLTLLALDLGDTKNLRERFLLLKSGLDFTDPISRQTLKEHEISPDRFQKTLLRLFRKYESVT